jgi:trehalose/maltose hydrolase-like predicted phosphorylase
MSSIKKKFETKYTVDEMKHFINTNILTNSVIKSVLETAQWNGNELFASSKLGKGYIRLSDYLIEIDIELNMFGSFAKKILESTLDDKFKQLKP